MFAQEQIREILKFGEWLNESRIDKKKTLDALLKYNLI